MREGRGSAPHRPAILIPELEEGGRRPLLRLAVVKGGIRVTRRTSSTSSPNAGHYLSHATAGNSHIILCTAKKIDDHADEDPTPPHSTPPVIDTDRVDTTVPVRTSAVSAAAALLVGAGAIVLGARRQGAHR